MTHEVTYGKDRYHQQGEMEKWCRQFIGEGNWTYNEPANWDQKLWVMWCMFGNTTFCFKNESDLNRFKQVWEI